MNGVYLCIYTIFIQYKIHNRDLCIKIMIKHIQMQWIVKAYKTTDIF